MKRFLISLTVTVLIGIPLTIFLAQAIPAQEAAKARRPPAHTGAGATALTPQGLQVLNPRGFVDRTLATLTDFSVEFATGSPGVSSFRALRGTVSELYIIRDAGGALNIDQYVVPGAQGTKELRPFSVGTLDISVGKIIYKDYTVNPPMVVVLAANVREQFSNVTKPEQVIRPLVDRILASVHVQSVENVTVSSISKSVNASLARFSDQARGEAFGAPNERGKKLKAAGNRLKTEIQRFAGQK